MISGPVSPKCSVKDLQLRRTQFLVQDHPLKQVFLLSLFRSTPSAGGVSGEYLSFDPAIVQYMLYRVLVVHFYLPTEYSNSS
jgi:hypothetical protein